MEYRSNTSTTTRLFCATCGCHVFRRLESRLAAATSDNALITSGADERWAVATGVIIGLDETREQVHDRDGSLIEYAKHINTASTKDGGLSQFIRRVGNSQELDVVEDVTSLSGDSLTPEQEKPGDSADHVKERGDILNASCRCKAVEFHVTRPNTTSQLPRSNFPDLMIPYHTGSPKIKNPEDVKWWLRPAFSLDADEHKAQSSQNGEARRYLAGTCACRSCRLTLGFEIQSWAFIPRANIFFHIRGDHTDLSNSEPDAGKDTQEVVPLDLETLSTGILRSYESSASVRREFCSRCGATVFWRDRWRPELMDVSVGLLNADEGATAETWLDWWTERVSFAEDAGNGRTGEMASNARCLIDNLETGLRGWAT